MRVSGHGGRAAWLVGVALAGASACSDPAAPRPDFTVQYQPCAAGTQVGAFNLVIDGNLKLEGISSFNGVVYDQPLVEADVVSASEGDCTLMDAATVLWCEAADLPRGKCAAGFSHSAGTVRLGGLTTPWVVEPFEGDFKGYDGGVQNIHFPPATPGMPITLSTSGGDYHPFQLDARGIQPLIPTLETLTLAPDQPLTVTWKDPGQPGPARMILSVFFANEVDRAVSPTAGSSHVTCNVADTGAATVPASLLTQLRAKGVGAHPVVVLERRTVDSQQMGAGCVELTVSSPAPQAIEVP
jgi:hypothetical protein